MHYDYIVEVGGRWRGVLVIEVGKWLQIPPSLSAAHTSSSVRRRQRFRLTLCPPINPLPIIF